MKAMKAIRPTDRQIVEAQRDWHYAIQPILKVKANVFLCAARTLTIKDGELPATSYKFTNEQQKLLDACDKLIDSMMPKVLRQTLDERDI